MLKQILYLEEEREDAIAVLDDTAQKQDMEKGEYNRRLAAIIIYYNNLITKITDENRQ